MTTNSFRKDMNPLHIAAVFLLALTGPVPAATDMPPAPVPRLGSVPDSAAWTIDYQYKSPNPYLKPPDPSQADAYARLRNQFARPLNIQVIKAGVNRKETLS